jgi:hypothetical protein
MKTRMRLTAVKLMTAVVLATTAAVSTGAQADEAAGTGPDNVIWVKTTGVNARDQQSGLQAAVYDGDNLQSANVARAESTDCTDCRTVAVAVQAVFATNHPRTVAPTNAAIALNQNCTRCTTFAYAYQYAVMTDGPVRVGRDERRKLARFRAEIGDVAQSDLPPDQLDARLSALTSQLKAEIDRYLREEGEHPRGRVKEDEEQGAQP